MSMADPIPEGSKESHIGDAGISAYKFLMFPQRHSNSRESMGPAQHIGLQKLFGQVWHSDLNLHEHPRIISG